MEDRIDAVRRRILAACRNVGRDPDGVALVAVTKNIPTETVRRAFALGLREFGENYARELAAKAQEIAARWHFLGKLQQGTAAGVAGSADVVHSAEPGRALERVARRARAEGRSITWLAQVDFTGSRQGVAPEELGEFIREADARAHITLAGLMTLPPPTPDPEGARPYFARLRELRDGLRNQWPELVELSMGMSSDLDVAVEEGATMVRVGTALFGPRPG